MTTKFIKIGHRGAKGHAPENTLSSIKKALELNVDMIEVDVHSCATGEIIVIHDDKLERTTNGKGYVRSKPLSYIKTLDAGNGEKVPTLHEVLDLIDKRVAINIELKGKFTLKPVMKIIEHYVKENGWRYDQFIVSTFMRKNLKRMAKMHSHVPIGALLAYRPYGFIPFAKSIDAYSVHLNAKLANPDIIAEAKKLGMKVFVWTVNKVDDIKRVKEFGADGIFSDFPDRL